MYIDAGIVWGIGGVVAGYLIRSVQLAYAKWRYIKDVEKGYIETKAAAIASKQFEARKLHPDQANQKMDNG